MRGQEAFILKKDFVLQTQDYLIMTLVIMSDFTTLFPLYFDICSLSYNLFALMHQLLPLEFANKRAKYIRYRLYAIAAKLIAINVPPYLNLRNGIEIL
jgi:hypothetical protein